MKISARLENRFGHHEIVLKTNGDTHPITIAPRSSGYGSSVNGGELLFLALATCYCNDVYREAAKRSITVDSIEVLVDGEFGNEGEPARNIQFNVKVAADGNENELRELLAHTDTVAEIHNTLRRSAPVTLRDVQIIPRR